MSTQFLGGLKTDERRLFHDRLRTVDRRLAPALSKLTWQRPRPAVDAFFNEAMWCVPWPAAAGMQAKHLCVCHRCCMCCHATHSHSV